MGSFTDDGWADSPDDMNRAFQRGPRGRSAEFGAGHEDARPDVQPGTQTHYWANKRYGDQKQLPTSGPRRAGPLPYPETQDDYHDSLDDLRRSHAE